MVPSIASRYLGVILVGLVLVFSTMGIGASLMGSETMQRLRRWSRLARSSASS